MIFTRGNRVEVMDPTRKPFPSWYPAVVLSGNATICNVKYESSPFELSDAMETRVSVKLVRPCPPPVTYPRPLVSGDVVEVLFRGSWKRAKVSSPDYNGNHYFISFINSSHSFRIHRSCIRLRQNWKKEKWSTIAKDLKKCKPPNPHDRVNDLIIPDELAISGVDGSFGKTTASKNVRILAPQKTTMKRKSNRQRKPTTPNTKTTTKKRSSKVNDVQRNQCRSSGDCCQLFLSICNVISRCKMLEEKCLQLSNNGMSRQSELDLGQGITEIRSLLMKSLEPYNPEDDNCSITCGFSGSNIPADALAGPQAGADDDFDDCPPLVDTREHLDSAAITRAIELRAYHSIMETLYTSGIGSLTWDQEMWLTNLRAALHISNTDHMRELKQLKSDPLK